MFPLLWEMNWTEDMWWTQLKVITPKLVYLTTWLYSSMQFHCPESTKRLLHIITPRTSFSQSRRNIDVTWRYTLRPRYTQRQKSVTDIHWKCFYQLNKGCRHDKFVLRYVTDVLRTQSRFVKCVGGGGVGLRPHPPQILQTYFGPEVRQ